MDVHGCLWMFMDVYGRYMEGHGRYIELPYLMRYEPTYNWAALVVVAWWANGGSQFILAKVYRNSPWPEKEHQV
jgi:hypothetical protein